MSKKETFLRVFNALASDETILSLLELNGQPEEVVQARIVKARIPSGFETSESKLCMWEPPSKPFSSRVERRFFQIDIYVPRDHHNNTGLGYDLEDAIRTALKQVKVGTGLAYEDIGEDDRQPPEGWYKSSVRFGYNLII